VSKRRVAAGTPRRVVPGATHPEPPGGALKLGAQGATTVAQLLDGPGIEVVPLSRPMAREAARLRARHGLGLADAVVAATALGAGCTALVGNDRAFRRLGDRLAYLHLDDLTPRRRDTAGP
ncbi:MAG: PIN domain-containing protein, partial [Candidatus Rokubacteria bacterium]|nr:PIN domain-containing protein [Candidatus Rokubacteria bacterium]